jgi:hypothetical protein
MKYVKHVLLGSGNLTEDKSDFTREFWPDLTLIYQTYHSWLKLKVSILDSHAPKIIVCNIEKTLTGNAELFHSNSNSELACSKFRHRVTHEIHWDPMLGLLQKEANRYG